MYNVLHYLDNTMHAIAIIPHEKIQHEIKKQSLLILLSVVIIILHPLIQLELMSS